MKVISIMNYKGSVGKNSITANIVAELAKRGKNILLIDLDPQASLTLSFIELEIWMEIKDTLSIKQWFDNKIVQDPLKIELLDFIIRPSNINNLILKGNIDLISSNFDLYQADLELSATMNAVNHEYLSQKFLNIMLILKNDIDKLRDRYDLILINCQQEFSIIKQKAIIASDFILLPLKYNELSILGLENLMSKIITLINRFNKIADMPIKPKDIGLVFSMLTENDKQNFNLSLIEKIKNIDWQYDNYEQKLYFFQKYFTENKSLFTKNKDSIPFILKQKAYYNQDNKMAMEQIINFVDEFMLKINLN